MEASKLVCLYISLTVACAASLGSSIPDNCTFKQDGTGNLIQGMFVFGSSLVDNGNNNFLATRSKADYLPYGIDFRTGPSGRFTNGKNVIDLLCDQLKIPLIPPFQDPSTKGSKIVHGVNHASGSSGILDDTGLVAGNATSLSQQIKDFEAVTLPGLEAQLGYSSSQSLPNYLIVVGVGGNDYMLNYFLRKLYLTISIETFTSNLIASLSQKLQKLYSLGGRKFVFTSLSPLGLSPVINRPNVIGTPSALNHAAQLYNARLQTLLDTFKTQSPDFSFVLVNQYDIIATITTTSTGFQDKRNPCCRVLSMSQGGNGISCERGGEGVCGNRVAYMYFDALHPTEAVNIEIATKAYASTRRSEAYPINVSQLAQLQT